MSPIEPIRPSEVSELLGELEKGRLTRNQVKIITAAVLGDLLEFFDYFLIGFVLSFIMVPWGLSYGESSIILLSSGVGAIAGGFFWGWFADRIGRRPVFISTILCFSLSTGVMYPNPRGWMALSLVLPVRDWIRGRRALLRGSAVGSGICSLPLQR